VKGEESKQYPKALLDALFAPTDLVSVAGPIEHNDWVYFVKAEERREGKVTPFEQAKTSIAQRMFRQKRLEAYDHYVSQLSDGTEVQTFPDKVAEAIKSNATKPGPPMGPVTLPTK
jgi:parvulin-like peptidyl-prolyl isomerase